jgi:hypothetical protein
MTRLLLFSGILVVIAGAALGAAEPLRRVISEPRSFLLIGLGLAAIGLVGPRSSIGGGKPK